MTKIIFKARVGSHLFGTATLSSDIDIKGVYVPSAREILMPITPEYFSLSTGTYETKNTADDVDEEYYAVHKFLNMVAKGDMIATEMLFAGNEILGAKNQLWAEIYNNRHHFLSRECKGFVGYVQRQANTYSIKGDRLNEIRHALEFIGNLKWNYPEAKKFSDIPDFQNVIARFCEMDGKKHTSCETIQSSTGQEIFHFVCCDRKVPGGVTFAAGTEIFSKVATEYGNRARAAADSNGRDWKALSHAVRVGEEALELLSTGKITFPRPNAAHLLDIKLGNVLFEKVAERLDELLTSVEQAVSESPLPEKPNYKYIEKFYINLYASQVIATSYENLNGE